MIRRNVFDGATGIAYSRLWRGALREDLCALGIDMVEIPHVMGIPVGMPLQDGFVRIAEWPNALGLLEPLDEASAVRWDPLLAPEPDHPHLLPASDHAPSMDAEQRTAFLIHVCARTSQIPGVSPVTTPEAPTTIVLTPGVEPTILEQLGERFGDAIQLVRPELAEFPGGLQLTITDEVWAQREEYAETVAAAIRGREDE